MCAGTDLVLVVFSVHDTDVFGGVRELTDVTTEEDRLASLDRPYDSSLKLLAHGIDVYEALNTTITTRWHDQYLQSTGRPPQMFPSLSTV